MDAPTPQIDPITTPSKGKWATIVEAVGNPFTFLTTWTKKSPLLSILAVVFLVQPVISTVISFVSEWRSVKEQLDPSKRPVSKAELDLVNTKIDFLQTLIVEDMKNDAKVEHPGSVDQTPTKVVPYVELQKKLTDVQQKLDKDFKGQAKK